MRNFELGEKAQAALRAVLAHDKQPVLDDLRASLEPPKVLVKITGFPDGEPPGVSDPGLREGEQATLAELERALEHASGRSRERIEEALTELRHKREGTWDPEQYEQRAGLQCPYCQAVTWDDAEEGIRVVDVSLRWSSFGYRAEENVIHGDYADYADYDGDHYECEECGHEVALPDDMEEVCW